MIAKKGQIYPRQCIQSNEIFFITFWKVNILLALYSSKDTTNFTNHEISERNMKFEICTTELCNFIFKNSAIEITTSSGESPEQN